MMLMEMPTRDGSLLHDNKNYDYILEVRWTIQNKL